MEKLTLDEIIKFSKGDVLIQNYKDDVIHNISTDSRTISKNELFLALWGEKFDGHHFILDVINKGVCSVIIDKKRWDSVRQAISSTTSCQIIGVEDTVKAYQDIAQKYLEHLAPIKIAITGSNGKTSTKEMIKAILSTQFNVIANKGNFNNQIGVPKTIFTINKTDEIALIEMGSGKKGDIEKLSAIVKPDFGVITNIGLAHTEFFGGQKGVAKEKKGLFSSFQNHSIALLNEDDPYYNYLKTGIKGEIAVFSIAKESHVRIVQNLGLNGYLLEYSGERCHFKLGGNHNLSNLHFAIVLAEKLRIPKKMIIKGIETIAPVKMRTETFKGKYTLIKDCYNANPSSMKAGLEYFSSLMSGGKKVCVLGDMLELGSESENLHIDIGDYFSKLKIDYLFTIGKLGKKIAEGALTHRCLKEQVYSFDDQNLLLEQIKELLNQDDLVYFKASRGMELEKVAMELEKLN